MAGWKRLAKATADGTSSTLSVSFTANDVIRLQIYAENTSGAGNFQIRFNNDTNANRHKTRRVYDGAGSGSNRYEDDSDTKFISNSATSALQSYMIIDVHNIDNEEHLVMGNCVESGATGAGSSGVPHTVNWMGKYTEKTPQVTSVQLITSSNNLNDKSYIIVLTTEGDSVTDEKDALTNVPASTRYEETDTRKIYRAVGDTVATFNHDFANGLSPLTIDSYSSSYISVTGGILDCNFPYASGNSQRNYGVSARYDFGADTISETNWVLRWKAKCNSFENAGVQFQVGLTDGDATVYSTATQTSIACLWQENNSVMLAQGNASVNGLNGADRTSTGTSLSNSTYYYFEMKRLAANSVGLKIGTSAYGGTEKGNITHTTSSSVDDLRYLTFTKEGRACTADVAEVIFFNNTTTGGIPFEWKERGSA